MNRSIVLAASLATLTGCGTAAVKPDAQQPQVIGATAGRSDNLAAAQQPVVATGVHFGGGEGASLDQAVTVLGASERTGVDAEYAWLHVHFPGYGHMQQALLNKANRAYDEMRFTTPNGTEHTIYFDITDYFGKF